MLYPTQYKFGSQSNDSLKDAYVVSKVNFALTENFFSLEMI